MKKIVIPVIALTAAVAAVAAGVVFALQHTPAGKTVKTAVTETVKGNIRKAAPEIERHVNAVTVVEPAAPQEETQPAAEATEATEADAFADGDKMTELAKEAVAKCTDSSMTKEQKLKAAFDYLKTNYLEGVRRDDYREMDWPQVYAEDIFVYGKGDCFSYGAAFAYMAKAIGYTDAYACNSGGHGWAEVNGKVYDPEWSMHSNKYSYFGMSYDQECDVPYKTALGDADWMHVQV